MLPKKSLKMEPLGLTKNAFPAYSYGHEGKLKDFSSVILNYVGKGFYRSIIRMAHILITLLVEKENLSSKQE